MLIAAHEDQVGLVFGSDGDDFGGVVASAFQQL